MGQLNSREEKYERNLAATKAFLKAPHTAAEVAERFGISKFAAYERIQQLALRREITLKGSQDPAGKTGPKAYIWSAI